MTSMSIPSNRTSPHAVPDPGLDRAHGRTRSRSRPRRSRSRSSGRSRPRSRWCESAPADARESPRERSAIRSRHRRVVPPRGGGVERAGTARSWSLATFAACVAVYVVTASVEFEIGPGSALPTTPVQVLMLFLLPPQLVPVAVLCGLGGAAVVGRLRDPERRERPLVLAGSGWQVVGPAVGVRGRARRTPRGEGRRRLRARARRAVRVRRGVVLDPQLLRAASGDRRARRRAQVHVRVRPPARAPIGLAAALARPGSAAALLFVLPLTALLAMLQSDRRRRSTRRSRSVPRSPTRGISPDAIR